MSVTVAPSAETSIMPTAPEFSAGSVEAPPELIIQARKGWIAIDWDELIRYRELLAFLVWRDVKVRYKQTVLGFAWAIIQPLMNSLIAVLIFGTGAGFQKLLPPDVPYLLFALAGQIPWQFFSTGLGSGGMSLVNQQHLITKIYFPRLFLPTGVIGGAMVDLLISLGLLLAFMIFYHFSPTYHFMPHWGLLLLPLLMIPLTITALGVAYLLSAVTVTYRDFRFLIPFMGQIWMYMSFVMIPRELITNHEQHPKLANWEWVLSLNPMYGIIQAFRHVTLGMAWNPWHLVTGTVVACVMCVFGMFYFRKTERRFADIA